MFKKLIIINAGLLLLSLAAAHGALAISFTPQVSIPGSDFTANAEKAVGDNAALICDYIVAIYKYVIAIIGVFAVVAIAFGGAIWVLAAGNSSRVGEAKSWIVGGLLGLALALGSFIILATISQELVTCSLQTIPKIAYKAPPALPTGFGTQYGIQGQRCQEPSSSLAKSGQFYCCEIYGDVDGSGWFSDMAIKRCATYEATDKDAAQAECNKFYDNMIFSGNDKNVAVDLGEHFLGSGLMVFAAPVGLFLTIDGSVGLFKKATGNGKPGLPLETREQSSSPADPDNQRKNTAEVYNGKCWSIPKIKEWCMGSDCPEYCRIKGDYRACVTTGGEWGYCESGNCIKCLKHCDPCTDDRQCPNQKKDPLTNGLAGVVCGEEIYSAWGSNSNDCVLKKGKKICDKEFGGGCP